jgi:hypothetical protein
MHYVEEQEEVYESNFGATLELLLRRTRVRLVILIITFEISHYYQSFIQVV